jgi:hypothetical protein
MDASWVLGSTWTSSDSSYSSASPAVNALCLALLTLAISTALHVLVSCLVLRNMARCIFNVSWRNRSRLANEGDDMDQLLRVDNGCLREFLYYFMALYQCLAVCIWISACLLLQAFWRNVMPWAIPTLFVSPWFAASFWQVTFVAVLSMVPVMCHVWYSLASSGTFVMPDSSDGAKHKDMARDAAAFESWLALTSLHDEIHGDSETKRRAAIRHVNTLMSQNSKFVQQELIVGKCIMLLVTGYSRKIGWICDEDQRRFDKLVLDLRWHSRTLRDMELQEP